MSKAITYYAQTPAIDGLCNKYGSFWQNLTTIERLNIAAAITESLVNKETDTLNIFSRDCTIDFIVASSGFEFENNAEVMQLLSQLDAELDSNTSVRLLEGIYANMTL